MNAFGRQRRTTGLASVFSAVQLQLLEKGRNRAKAELIEDGVWANEEEAQDDIKRRVGQHESE